MVLPPELHLLLTSLLAAPGVIRKQAFHWTIRGALFWSVGICVCLGGVLEPSIGVVCSAGGSGQQRQRQRQTLKFAIDGTFLPFFFFWQECLEKIKLPGGQTFPSMLCIKPKHVCEENCITRTLQNLHSATVPLKTLLPLLYKYGSACLKPPLSFWSGVFLSITDSVFLEDQTLVVHHSRQVNNVRNGGDMVMFRCWLDMLKHIR